MNKKGESRTIPQMILSGGVPLAFVLFGLFFIFSALTSTPQNNTHLIWGLASAGFGGWLFYKIGTS